MVRQPSYDIYRQFLKEPIYTFGSVTTIQEKSMNKLGITLEQLMAAADFRGDESEFRCAPSKDESAIFLKK